ACAAANRGYFPTCYEMACNKLPAHVILSIAYKDMLVQPTVHPTFASIKAPYHEEDNQTIPTLALPPSVHEAVLAIREQV
ncbi:MAG: hypothetical protein Q4D56_06335, partial [Bacteroides sp.]|nr:hypothetical protein [Bacteroides sp.]